MSLPAIGKCATAVLLFALAAWPSEQAIRITGRVVDETGVPVGGARLTLAGKELAGAMVAATDEAGRFTLDLPAAGAYDLTVTKPGFYAYVARAFPLSGETGPIEVVLNHQQEFEETVSVVYAPPTIDLQQTGAERTIRAEQIVAQPYPATHDFRSALPLLPGVIKDNAGRIHLGGGDESQTYYSLDGFNIGHPVSGGLVHRLSADTVRAVRVETSRYSAEHGKGSAGVLALETFQGDDRFRFMATNFLPSFETREGLHISGWTPRATFSGPLSRGRAWFHDAVDLQYDLNVVRGLPKDANRNTNWNGGNLTRLQYNLSPGNILTAGLLFNFTDSSRYGLSPLDPRESTRDIFARSYFFNLKDQIYLERGWILELGAGVNRWNSHERPLGDGVYVISPEGRSGNFFRTSDQRTRRLQFLANVSSGPLHGGGRHELKFGVGADRIRYRQFAARRPEEILRESGVRARFITFAGGPSFGAQNTELSTYVQDRWSPSAGLLIEAGIRLDRDAVLGRNLLSPRLAVAYVPRFLNEAKFSAGAGIFRDAVNLDLLTRPLDQTRSDTFYAKDGETVVAGPIESRYRAVATELRAPYYRNWSLEWEQKLPKAVYLSAGFIRKNGRNGWAYDTSGAGIVPGAGTILHELTDRRRDSYSYLEFTARRTFLQKYSCMVSYARSSARSTAVLDFSLENPIFSRQAGGPLPWDTPHRLISYGVLPVPRLPKYTLAYFFEWRSGLPYSLVDEEQRLVGSPNARRFPDHLSLHVHLERRFRFWRCEWAVRAGFNNITGRDNPSAVNNNVDSPLFGRFSGLQGRTFNGRIRFLGRS